MDHYARAYPIFSRIWGYRGWKKMLYSLKGYSASEIAQKRMKIIKFYEEYGEEATREAFGADRKVIHQWRKRLKENGGRLESLVPVSTRPNRVRQSSVPVEMVGFIKELREAHPRLGKDKIKVLLDKECQKRGWCRVSASTIGNILKRHQMFFQRSGRIYHDPSSHWARQRSQRGKRLRVRHPPKPSDGGYILSDTVERVTEGIKDYFLSAIDAKLKFALTLNYKRLNSQNMRDFYRRFKTVYPGVIKTWQSDNGSENLGEFKEQLRKDGIPHYFIYPHCPRINTYIERYNRTLQEEFIENNLDIIHDKPLFSKALAEYLIFYNAQRPNKSLGLKSPLEFLVEQGGMSQMSLTHTRG